MSLSDKDRKLLWGKAGGRCSYRFEKEICGETLSVEDAGKNIVVGEEAHIVGEARKSARYIRNFPEPDAYPNRILLCRKHHKIVDDNKERYTVEVMRAMKAEHEKTIRKDKEPADRLVIKDSTFSTTAKDTKRAVGMEVNRLAELSGVQSKLHASNVEEAIGFSTNQGLTGAIHTCSRCNKRFPVAFTGPPPPLVTCTHCGNEQPV